MELYSLGVDGGYAQADVIALARLLTGWSIDFAPGRAGQGFGKGAGRMARFFQARFNQPESIEGASSGFRYFPARHEPGPVTLRGKTYSDGFGGGRAAIHDLAHDPATAKFIAAKFARHFVADTPSPQLVARLERSFRDTQGDLKALTITMLEDPSAWDAGAEKMRNPVEFVTASYRLLGLPRAQNSEQQIRGAMQACRMMGHFPMAAPSPKGWSDHVGRLVGAGCHSVTDRMGASLGLAPAAECQRGPDRQAGRPGDRRGAVAANVVRPSLLRRRAGKRWRC